jgi:hypothetical protein
VAYASIRGVREFQQELRRLERAGLGGALQKANLKLAKDAARELRRVTGQRLGRAISVEATATTARITFRKTPTTQDAFVRFFGAHRRTGWYAPPRYRRSTRQHPVHVGKGEPYLIGPFLRTFEQRAVDTIRQFIDRAYEDTFN